MPWQTDSRHKCFPYTELPKNRLQKIIYNPKVKIDRTHCNGWDRGLIKRYKTELKTCPKELIDLSVNHLGNGYRQSLPSMVTHPLIRVKQGFQCIPHDLNIKHDVINSTVVDNDEVMIEFDSYTFILQKNAV